jgi:hypothetical protein
MTSGTVVVRKHAPHGRLARGGHAWSACSAAAVRRYRLARRSGSTGVREDGCHQSLVCQSCQGRWEHVSDAWTEAPRPPSRPGAAVACWPWGRPQT